MEICPTLKSFKSSIKYFFFFQRDDCNAGANNGKTAKKTISNEHVSVNLEQFPNAKSDCNTSNLQPCSVIDQARSLRMEAEMLSLSRTETIERLQANLIERSLELFCAKTETISSRNYWMSPSGPAGQQ